MDLDGQVNRWYYTVKGERELKRIVAIRSSTVFDIMAEKIRQISRRDMLLTPQRFCLTTQNESGFMGLHLESAPHVRLAFSGV